MKKKYVNKKKERTPLWSEAWECIEPSKILPETANSQHSCAELGEHQTHRCCCGATWETYE